MRLVLVVDLRDRALPSLSHQTEMLRVISAAVREWRDEAEEDGWDEAEEAASSTTDDTPCGQIRGVLVVSDSMVARMLWGAVATIVRRRSSSFRLAISTESPVTDADAIAHLG